MALTDRDRAILDFEGGWWRHPGPKEAAIRQQFDLSGSRYYQILRSLADSGEAMEHQPLVVARLRRCRLERLRARFEGPATGGERR